jgi:hypothetical protein
MPNNTDKLRQLYVDLSRSIDTVKQAQKLVPSAPMDFFVEESTNQMKMILALVQDEIKHTEKLE